MSESSWLNEQLTTSVRFTTGSNWNSWWLWRWGRNIKATMSGLSALCASNEFWSSGYWPWLTSLDLPYCCDVGKFETANSWQQLAHNFYDFSLWQSVVCEIRLLIQLWISIALPFQKQRERSKLMFTWPLRLYTWSNRSHTSIHSWLRLKIRSSMLLLCQPFHSLMNFSAQLPGIEPLLKYCVKRLRWRKMRLETICSCKFTA